MKARISPLLGSIAALAIWSTAQAAPVDQSFSGNFSFDDDVVTFDFIVGTISNVTVRTYGYAGGTNAAGELITAGGLDPVVGIFDRGTGALLDQVDDGGLSVGSDPGTGQQFDAFLEIVLGPGDYRVAMTQYDNFAIGPSFADGFSRTGEPNFTGGFGCTNGVFCDNSGVAVFNNRTSFWALDILGVDPGIAVAVPVPGTLTLFGAGLLGLALAWRSRR